jgi:hypothetical protein
MIVRTTKREGPGFLFLINLLAVVTESSVGKFFSIVLPSGDAIGLPEIKARCEHVFVFFPRMI